MSSGGIDLKECFIVTPIGSAGSEIRRETEGLIHSVLTPVLAEFELQPVAAHQISETGSITRQIIKRLLESELVVANLTGLNPNVMYEVGIRHCSRKPLIVLAREGTVLPFDLSDERTVFYRNDLIGSEELKDQLKSVIPPALNDLSPDNPVYRVVEVDMIKVPENGGNEVSSVFDKRLSIIESQLEIISGHIRSEKRYSAPPHVGALFSSFHASGVKRRSLSFNVEDDARQHGVYQMLREAGFEYETSRVYKDVESCIVLYSDEEQKQLLLSILEVCGIDYKV